MVPVAVADYLLNNKRKEIFELEQGRGVAVTIEGDPRMVPGDSKVTCK
jgi:Ribonuclease G/E